MIPLRCSWLQNLIDREIEARRKADLIMIKSAELENLRRSRLKYGYDPYDNASASLNEWLKAA